MKVLRSSKFYLAKEFLAMKFLKPKSQGEAAGHAFVYTLKSQDDIIIFDHNLILSP